MERGGEGILKQNFQFLINLQFYALVRNWVYIVVGTRLNMTLCLIGTLYAYKLDSGNGLGMILQPSAAFVGQCLAVQTFVLQLKRRPVFSFHSM